MAKKERNPLSEFWTLLKQTPGYNEAYKDAIKASWVNKFSNGQTNSLTDLYNAYYPAYGRMISEMRAEIKEVADRQDKQRKRLIAAVFEFHRRKKYECDMKKAIAVACKSCGVSKLNDATEQQVIAAIKRFADDNNRMWAEQVLSDITIE